MVLCCRPPIKLKSGVHDMKWLLQSLCVQILGNELEFSSAFVSISLQGCMHTGLDYKTRIQLHYPRCLQTSFVAGREGRSVAALARPSYDGAGTDWLLHVAEYTLYYHGGLCSEI